MVCHRRIIRARILLKRVKAPNNALKPRQAISGPHSVLQKGGISGGVIVSTIVVCLLALASTTGVNPPASTWRPILARSSRRSGSLLALSSEPTFHRIHAFPTATHESLRPVFAVPRHQRQALRSDCRDIEEL